MIKYHLTQDAVDAGCKFEKPRSGDLGYDIHARNTDFIFETATRIHTGLYVEIPEGYVGIVKDRSSMALNDIVVHAGVIDSSYRGEIILLMSTLDDKETSMIAAGQKIAQMLIVPALTESTEMVSLEELTQTERGDRGFGSTGS
jgi:dUTP pyrophosphatase